MQDAFPDPHDEVQWLAIEEPEKKRRSPKKAGFYLLIGAAVLMGCGTTWAVVQKIRALSESGYQAVTVASQRKAKVLNAESHAAFRSFDGTLDLPSQFSGDSLRERTEIAAFFSEIESSATSGDPAAFRSQVDFNRLLKRIDLLGTLRYWSRLEKKYLRTNLKSSVSTSDSWQKLIIAAVLHDKRDPSSRIVYAYGWDEQAGEYSEFRFWIAHTGSQWKLYDWEQLDLGLSVSQEWSLYVKYVNTPRSDSFSQWTVLISEADDLLANGDYEAAEAKLRLAESEVVPSEFQDYCWLLSGYRWQMYGEMDEAKRCFETIFEPDSTPGAYYGLMSCQRQSHPSQSLANAEKYENTVGPTPDLCRSKAQLLRQLGRKQEAVEEWKQLVRILPQDSAALAEMYQAIPSEKKKSFEDYIEQQKIPLSTVVEIANTVAYSDYPGLLRLVDYLQRKEPSSAQTLGATGLAKHLGGEYRAAADLFHQAFNLDSEKKETYVHNYLDAMAEIGQATAGWKNAPDPVVAFQWLVEGYEEGEISLSKKEYGQLVDLFRSRYPKEPTGLFHAATLALDDDRSEEAEKLLRNALREIRSEVEKEGYEYLQNRCHYLLTRALFEQDQLAEAYELSEDPNQRFSQLVWLATDSDRWDDLEQLLKIHRANEPEDHNLSYAKGEIAAHEERYRDAIQLYLQCIESVGADPSWQYENRLREVCVESGLWKDYYQQSKNSSETFLSLAEDFLEEKNWEAFNQLLAHHRKQSHGDPRIVLAEAAAAWELKDYATFSSFAETALGNKDTDILPHFERKRLENRLFSALLRSRSYEKALTIAVAESKKENDKTSLAIVRAVRGDAIEALGIALQAAAQDETASSFYLNDDVGPLFLSRSFSDLQKKYPVGLPYNCAPVSSVFLYDSPFQLDTKKIYAALVKLGIKTTATIQPLATHGEAGVKVFVLTLGRTRLWLASGTGKFKESWNTESEDHSLADIVDDSQAWLAVGTTGWTSLIRTEGEKVACELAAELSEGSAKALCIKENPVWGPTIALPVSDDLLTAWKNRARLKPFLKTGLTLGENPDEKLEANRRFRAELREAIRSFEADSDINLEVMVSLTDEILSDPLWLRVNKVKRSYGGATLEGFLQDNSQLIPQLKAGLSVGLRESEIKAWRTNEDASDP